MGSNKGSISKSYFYQTSEVYQELVYEMYQTKIQGNDWVRYGLAPMTTTQIVHSWYEQR
jgi:hypothetical protein